MANVRINGNRMNVGYNNIIIKLKFTSATIFKLSLKADHEYDFIIMWGDGSKEHVQYSEIVDSTVNHNFGIGEFSVKINGVCEFLDLSNQTNLISVDSWGKPEITKLKRVNFLKCGELKYLPHEKGGLRFIETFDSVFSQCIKLEELPQGLFGYNSTAVNFDRVFINCYGLKKLPKDLFKDNIGATSFNYSFSNTNITSIPSNLFDNNTEVTTFINTFSNTNITSISSNLFDNNTKVTSFSGTFGVSSLSKIPDGIFDTNTLVTDFSNTFNSTNITSIPSNLFDNNLNVTTFSNTFNDCDLLTGCAPKIWDDSIWEQVTTNVNCFENCTSLSNYDSIEQSGSATTFTSASTSSFEIPTIDIHNNSVAVRTFKNTEPYVTANIVSIVDQGGGISLVSLDGNALDVDVDVIKFKYNSCGTLIPTDWK